MARLSRIVPVNIPHHVTQRGNARRPILNSDNERLVYLDLLRTQLRLYELSLLGYCLMSNHVHLVVVPHRADSLALALKYTHGRYASFWNATHQSSGHVWQGRFYSCPLDCSHLWIALRYTELNPVRAGMVQAAENWPWSSAGAHCGCRPTDDWLEMEAWNRRWSMESWKQYLRTAATESELDAIRQHTHTGRPLGGQEFVRDLEVTLQRRLVPQKGGRPPRVIPKMDQLALPLAGLPGQALK